MRNPILILALVLIAGCSTSMDPATDVDTDGIVGRASVRDGDTLEIRGQRIRLDGIDAPEIQQTCIRDGVTERCGRIASSHLRKRVGWQPVRCEDHGRDRYNRVLGYCYQEGVDLNEMMVRDGQALAYRQYSRRYVTVENEARQAGLGIWGTEFEMPWNWRRAN